MVSWFTVFNNVYPAMGEKRVAKAYAALPGLTINNPQDLAKILIKSIPTSCKYSIFFLDKN